MRRNKAFTLVEIMIVVLIIGILMSIAVPNFVKARESSRRNTCIANLKRIDSSKEQWAMEQRKIAGDACAMTDLVGTAAYMKATPACPSGGTYTVNAVGTNPVCSITGHTL